MGSVEAHLTYARYVNGIGLVTGAAGFIGSHLVDRLLMVSRSVVGIDSSEDYYPRHLKEADLATAHVDPRFGLIEANILDLNAAGAESRFSCSLSGLGPVSGRSPCAA